MRTYLGQVVTVLVLISTVMAATEDPAKLKARADAAKGQDQAKLCMEYASVQLEAAAKLYDNGEIDPAQALIREVVVYSQKAGDAASGSGKHLKDTEIRLRKLGERMHDIGESLAFEDREPVRDAVQQIEHIRSDLMVRMWGPQAEPKGRS